jgi:hypothetical protein
LLKILLLVGKLGGSVEGIEIRKRVESSGHDPRSARQVRRLKGESEGL